FQYVGSAIFSTAALLIWHTFLVGKYRKRAGIKYPQAYAEKAEVEASNDAHLFNCAQRTHQNTLEHIPIIWATTLIVGSQMPVLAASVCGLWSLSRVTYTLGYLSGDPAKRISPLYKVSGIASLGVTAGAAYYAGLWVWQGVSAKFCI
ncbi:hypothetical protein AGABI1DRAFT_81868, partial [Agaricus bisporus var. burnettii JB137-S8]